MTVTSRFFLKATLANLIFASCSYACAYEMKCPAEGTDRVAKKMDEVSLVVPVYTASQVSAHNRRQSMFAAALEARRPLPDPTEDDDLYDVAVATADLTAKTAGLKTSQSQSLKQQLAAIADYAQSVATFQHSGASWRFWVTSHRRSKLPEKQMYDLTAGLITTDYAAEELVVDSLRCLTKSVPAE